MRLVLSLAFVTIIAASCGSSAETAPVDTSSTSAASSSTTSTSEVVGQGASEPGPGGYGFDRSDPEAGVANIMAAFATDEATATCIYEAWGDVANVPPAELTPELMTFEVCGTSIFQLMSGDSRFTGTDG